jgi:beta-lactamase regulating signal transducer with metallopeptidase domain/outer membrane biosynthesis protein TonB
MNWLIDYSLRVSIVLALAFLITKILNRRSAALKHVVWCCAFGVALLTPLFMIVGPKFQIVHEKVVEPAPTGVSGTNISVAQPVKAVPPSAATESCGTGFSLSCWGDRLKPVPLEILWIAGMMAFAARLWKGQRDARALVRDASPLSEGIAESEAIASPVTTGIWKPCILLPVEHRDWDPEFLKAAIEHELAHVRRRDCLVQWLPNVVCIVQWFNPLVWLARAEMLCESERACDDSVIRSGAKGSAFARDLVDVAKSICSKGNSSMSIALTTKLERRIARLLDQSADRTPLRAARVIPGAVVALALLAPIAGLRAEQVTKFKTSAPIPAPSTQPAVAPEVPKVVAKKAPRLIAQAQTVGRAQPAPAAVAPDSSATGTMSGIVTDPSGAVVPNARILLTLLPGDDAAKPINYSTTTGPIGQWSLTGLPVGQYNIDVAVPGFNNVRTNFVSQQPGFNSTFTTRLTIGRIMESVTISKARANSQTTLNATAAATSKPVRVGGNVQAARLIRKVDPIYPQAAIDRGLQGPVTFIAIVDKQGFVRDVVVNNGPPELAQAGMTAIWGWQYEPTKLNGEPVEIVTEITVNFQLE